MKLALLVIILSVATIPFFSFAQTSTSTAFDIDKYITDVEQLTRDVMIKQETEFINPAKIRAKAVADYMDIKTSPRNPGPNETISVTAESYLSDLNKATISWSVNGKVLDRGTGKTSFSFKNGGSGETTRLTIFIVTNTGENVTKELTFNPVGVTILWEADTYTPPFYKGKPLMTAQARVRVVATPDAANSKNSLNAGNLVFVWEKDGNAIQESSGYGKNSFSFTGPKPYGETNVRVKVSSLNDAISSEMRIYLPLSRPFILFYENNPLLGTRYNKPLDTKLTLTKRELSVTAEPYFFSNEYESGPPLYYSWSLNGKGVATAGRTVTLRNEAGSKGASELALAIRSPKLLFQSASRSLTINFTVDESARPNF